MPRPSSSKGGGARPESRAAGRKPQVRWLGRAYQGALEAALALAIAVLAGAWVDERFETAPVGVIVGLLFGFAAFTLRLVRLVGEAQKASAQGGEKAAAPDEATNSDPHAGSRSD